MMPSEAHLPVIACDVDGVLTDTFDIWALHYRRQKCGVDHAERPLLYTWDAWEDICSICWQDVIHRREILLAHELRRGVDKALSDLSKIANLHVVTSRPESTADATREWLFRRDIFPYFKGLHLTHNKRDLCEKIGAVALIDDGPHNIEAVRGSNTVPVIFHADYNAHLAGHRVSTWKEAAAVLTSIAQFSILTRQTLA